MKRTLILATILLTSNCYSEMPLTGTPEIPTVPNTSTKDEKDKIAKSFKSLGHLKCSSEISTLTDLYLQLHAEISPFWTCLEKAQTKEVAFALYDKISPILLIMEELVIKTKELLVKQLEIIKKNEEQSPVGFIDNLSKRITTTKRTYQPYPETTLEVRINRLKNQLELLKVANN